MTLALGAELLALGGPASNTDDGRARIEEAFSSGRAAEAFGRMVTALGGPADFLDKPDAYLRGAPVVRPVLAVGSLGRGNPFGLPAPEVLARYRSHGARWESTDRAGELIIESDGQRTRLRRCRVPARAASIWDLTSGWNQ